MAAPPGNTYGFKKGQSGNPGGRTHTEKAWFLATGGKKAREIAAEALRIVWERMLKGPDGGKNGDPDWRFATQKVLEYTLGNPKQSIEITGDATERPTLDTSAMSVDQLRQAIGAIQTLKDLGVASEAPPGDGSTEH